MGLVLSFKPGADFYVADTQFFVTEASGVGQATVVGPNGTYELTDHRAVEIYPGCPASLSDKSAPGLAAIVFGAPKTLPIVTGDKYRAGTKPKVEAQVSSTAEHKVTSIYPAAIEQAKAIGFVGNVEKELLDLLALSAPVTHRYGNRRFDELVFDVQNGRLRSVACLTDAEFEALDERHHRERTGRLKPWVRLTGG
jgi:hypothetical protein